MNNAMKRFSNRMWYVRRLLKETLLLALPWRSAEKQSGSAFGVMVWAEAFMADKDLSQVPAYFKAVVESRERRKGEPDKCDKCNQQLPANK